MLDKLSHRITYVIVLPNEGSSREEKVFDETLFNRFDDDINRANVAMKIIGQLPATILELVKPCREHSDRSFFDQTYYIKYIKEKNITKELIEEFTLRSIVVLVSYEDVRKSNVYKLSELYSIPIIYIAKDEVRITYRKSEGTYRRSIIWNSLYDQLKGLTHIEQEDIEVLKTEIKVWDRKNYGYDGDIGCYVDPLNYVIDRIRGLYDRMGGNLVQCSPMTPDQLNEYEQKADENINRALCTLIAEKYVVDLLATNKERELLNFGISNEEVKNLKEKFTQDIEGYKRIIQKVYNHLFEIEYQTNMFLCVPSINYEYMRLFFDNKVQDEVTSEILKSSLKVCYDSNSYYTVMKGDQTEEEIKMVLYALGQRTKELNILSMMFVCFALGERLPYIRCRNVASSSIYTKINNIQKLIRHTNNISRISTKITKGIRDIADEISTVIFNSENNLEGTIKKFANHISVISDLPIQFIEIDKIPIGVLKSVSYIPVTPGNILVQHMQQRQVSSKLFLNRMSILFINTLSRKDKDERFKDRCKLIKERVLQVDKAINIIYKEVENKKEYCEVIGEIRPDILIHYGHGDFDTWGSTKESDTTMQSYLMIGNQIMDSVYLENNLTYTPKIVILGACTTQVSQGPYLNIANTFLGLGCLNVVGTVFQVESNYTLYYIEYLLRSMCKMVREKAVTWADIILIANRYIYMESPLFSMYEKYGIKKSEVEKIYGYNVQDKIQEYVDKKTLSFEEVVVQRDLIYSEILKDSADLSKKYSTLKQHKLITPHNLFFISLGSPEKVIIKE